MLLLCFWFLQTKTKTIITVLSKQNNLAATTSKMAYNIFVSLFLAKVIFTQAEVWQGDGGVIHSQLSDWVAVNSSHCLLSFCCLCESVRAQQEMRHLTGVHYYYYWQC